MQPIFTEHLIQTIYQMNEIHNIPPRDLYNICLLKDNEQQLRLSRVKAALAEAGIEAALISDYANLFYLCGRVFCGWILVSTSIDSPLYFLRRPDNLHGEKVYKTRKVEEIRALLKEAAGTLPDTLGLELGLTSYSDAIRAAKAFEGMEIADCTGAMQTARAVKTKSEADLLRLSGERHVLVYRQIPKLYREGMSDIELQIEIERAMRLEGNLGQFRISGKSMEIFMGALLAGDNADNLSPYDFALGGAGLSPSLPVGADGTIIRPGTTVLVDLGGDFNGYMTDMSRVFALGDIPQTARKAHQVSIDIHRRVADEMRPGMEARLIYDMAKEMAVKAGLADYFMGHRYHAGFVGHGVGIEINEKPVLAPRSKDMLQTGNVIALEPKFVIPHVGAVGIENTYYMSDEGRLECLTPAPEDIIRLSV